jgi:hypothetical protein
MAKKKFHITGRVIDQIGQGVGASVSKPGKRTFSFTILLEMPKQMPRDSLKSGLMGIISKRLSKGNRTSFSIFNKQSSIVNPKGG